MDDGNCKYNKRNVGNMGENLATDYLKKKGHVLLERNYRNRFGEIDIITRDGDTLVFSEVKYRSNNAHGNPLEAVNDAKKRKISRVAAYYCTGHGLWERMNVRFDVIAVWGDGNIEHVENAFEFAGYRI